MRRHLKEKLWSWKHKTLTTDKHEKFDASFKFATNFCLKKSLVSSAAKKRHAAAMVLIEFSLKRISIKIMCMLIEFLVPLSAFSLGCNVFFNVVKQFPSVLLLHLRAVKLFISPFRFESWSFESGLENLSASYQPPEASCRQTSRFAICFD